MYRESPVSREKRAEDRCPLRNLLSFTSVKKEEKKKIKKKQKKKEEREE